MKNKKIVVLGIGNVLWADEGFGVRFVEALQALYNYSPEIELVDGGTQGLYLLEYVQTADCLMILDAIDYGLTPGTLKIIENDDVPRFLGAKKMSLHQTGFQEVLQISQLTGRYPSQVVLIGCQPEFLEDYGGSLRDSVKLALTQAIPIALARLREWGVKIQKKSDDEKQADILSISAYEQGRPSEELACRVGDERFLKQG